MEHHFSLVVEIPLDTNLDDLVERLGAAGCTDALVGIGAVGRIVLDFAREAASEEDAFRSAIADVRRAIPTAVLTALDFLEGE